MSKLNILGAQRVKALTEMLNEQEREAISKATKKHASKSDLIEIVDTEFGVNDKRRVLIELNETLKTYASEIVQITGEQISIGSIAYNTYNNKKTKWSERLKELLQIQQQEIEQIKEDFANKKRKLWLCETLEEAKELVGV